VCVGLLFSFFFFFCCLLFGVLFSKDKSEAQHTHRKETPNMAHRGNVCLLTRTLRGALFASLLFPSPSFILFSLSKCLVSLPVCGRCARFVFFLLPCTLLLCLSASCLLFFVVLSLSFLFTFSSHQFIHCHSCFFRSCPLLFFNMSLNVPLCVIMRGRHPPFYCRFPSLSL
jgi:hypothetical protein